MQQTQLWCVKCVQNLKPSDGAARGNNCSNETHYFCGKCLKEMPTRFRCPLKNCLMLIEKSKMSAVPSLSSFTVTESAPTTTCNHDLVGAFAKVCFNDQCEKDSFVFCNSCPKDLQHNDCAAIFAFEFPKKCKVECPNLGSQLTQTLSRLLMLKISIDNRLKLAELNASEERLLKNLNVVSFVTNRNQFLVEANQAKIVIKSRALERLNFLLTLLEQLQPVADLGLQVQERFDEWASWNNCKSFPVKVVQITSETNSSDQDESRLNLNTDTTETTESQIAFHQERELMVKNPPPQPDLNQQFQQQPNQAFQQEPTPQLRTELNQITLCQNRQPQSDFHAINSQKSCSKTTIFAFILAVILIIILFKILLIQLEMMKFFVKKVKIEAKRINKKLLQDSLFAQSSLLNGNQAVALTILFQLRKKEPNKTQIFLKYNSKSTIMNPENFKNQFKVASNFLLIIKTKFGIGGFHINTQLNNCLNDQIKVFSLNRKLIYTYPNLKVLIDTFDTGSGLINSWYAEK